MPRRSPVALEFKIEFQAGSQALGTVAQLAGEFLVAVDPVFPFLESDVPGGVGLEQAGEIPGCPRL